MSGGSKRWSKEELQALLNGIGAYGIKWFQKRTQAPNDWPNAPQHRSVAAIYAQARRQHGPGGLTRGALTLRELSLNTGYGRSQLLRAREALHQKWKRLGPRGDHIITEEQAEEVLEWLKHDYWDKDKRLYCCLWCQTEKRPPHGQGLCGRCYFRYRRRLMKYGLPTNPHVLNEKVVALAENLEGDKSNGHGRVLETVAHRLGRGHALEISHLAWLHQML